MGDVELWLSFSAMLDWPDLLAGFNLLLEVVLLSEISICLCLSICDFSFLTSSLDFLYIAIISFLVMGGGGPTCALRLVLFPRLPLIDYSILQHLVG